MMMMMIYHMTPPGDMRDQEHDHGEGEHHRQAQLPPLLGHAPLHGLLQGNTCSTISRMSIFN